MELWTCCESTCAPTPLYSADPAYATVLSDTLSHSCLPAFVSLQRRSSATNNDQVSLGDASPSKLSQPDHHSPSKFPRRSHCSPSKLQRPSHRQSQHCSPTVSTTAGRAALTEWNDRCCFDIIRYLGDAIYGDVVNVKRTGMQRDVSISQRGLSAEGGGRSEAASLASSLISVL